MEMSAYNTIPEFNASRWLREATREKVDNTVIRTVKVVVCGEVGCDRRVMAAGLCSKHYYRIRRSEKGVW